MNKKPKYWNVVTKSSLLKNYCPAEEYHQRYLEKR
ncbi:peptide-methionine (S)-S-oxide reductase [Candidatus Pelagibacter ubique]|nr:peptide-methionine (S)-S-oxide reductase [Candidatus Pelagibacter ubique]